MAAKVDKLDAEKEPAVVVAARELAEATAALDRAESAMNKALARKEAAMSRFLAESAALGAR
jgi:hypothetical protein